VKANKKFPAVAVVAVAMLLFMTRPSQLPAQTAAAKSAGARQWSVQVDKVDPGEVNLASSFQVAIYENLLDELGKTKSFQQVFRSGDRNATNVSDLLILKRHAERDSASQGAPGIPKSGTN